MSKSTIIPNSQRNSKIFKNKSSILNPTNIKISENIPQNKAPFNSKMEKFFEFQEKRGNILGPGAYYHPNQSSFIKRTFKRDTSAMEEIHKNELYNIALFKVVNRKKDQKLKEQKSLVIDKDNKNQVFNINSNSGLNKSTDIDENNSKLNSSYKLIPTTLTKNRINSIPSKEHYLGYDFDMYGLPMIVDSDPLNDIDNKNNNFSKNKKINALDWSKMSKKEISLEPDITTKENTLYDEVNDLTRNITNSSVINNINKPSRNKSGFFSSISNNELTTNNNISKSYKSYTNILSQRKLNLNRRIYQSPSKELHLRKKKSLEDFVYDNLFNGDPGPGYYQSNSSFDKYNIFNIKNKKYNFGSNSKRNNNFVINNNNESLGPGAYFKEKYKQKQKPDFHPFNRVENKINIKKYEKQLDNEKIGPGRYNIKSQFDVEKLHYSGSLEKRFFEIDKKINIGPGEYLQLYDWNKNNDINGNDEKSKAKEINDKGRDSYLIKNDNPGAGYYNPDIVKSIKYDAISKESKLSNLNIPFNSVQKRFLVRSSTTSNLLGPGKYFYNNNSIGSNNINNMGKMDKNKGLYKINGLKIDELKDKHHQLKLERDSIVGPGSYNINNFKEWHKKSFNSLMYL